MARNEKDFGYYAASFLTDYLPSKKGCSQKTVASYRDTLVLLIELIEAGGRAPVTFESIDARSVEAFLDHLEADRGNSVSTRNQRQAALNSFFAFVRTREPALYSRLTQAMGVPRKRSAQPKMPYLTVAEVEALFACIDGSTKKGLRDKAMVGFLYEAAARVEELTGCLRCQLRLGESPYVELHGKGRKTRNVPITKGYAELVGAYASAYDVCRDDQPLFVNRCGQPLTSKGVAYVLGKRLEAAAERMPSIGKKRITCHSLRHSRAMHLLEAGVNLIYIRDVLGHSSITTTEIYAKTNPEIKRRLLEEHGASYAVTSRYTQSERDDLAKWLRESF